MTIPSVRVEVYYGDDAKCPEDSFRVVRTCSERPGVASPEYLLSYALYKDRFTSLPSEISLLLKTAEGPNTVVKAAGVSPTNWEGLLYLATYTDDGTQESSCACLLPFAPNVSTLAGLGKEKVCIDAENLDPEFIYVLLHTLIATGTREVILLNPPYFELWGRLRLSGIRGYRIAVAEKLPRAVRIPVLASVKAELEANEIHQAAWQDFRLPKPRETPNFLGAVFHGEEAAINEILQELESTGHVMSYRSFLDVAREMLPQKAAVIARSLHLYGYVQIRQGQVELTRKGLFALTLRE